MRAQNAKKKNYTEEKLDKKIEISDATIAQYLDEMDEFDKTEALTLEQAEKKKYVETKLEEAKKWKEKFTAFKQELKQRQEIDPEVTQISLTDPDARSIVLNNSGHSEVAYNVVTAVDEKHKLIANFFADNVKDYVHLPKNACPNPLSKTAFQGKLKEPNTNKPVRIIKKGWLLWQVKSFTKNGKPSWSILSALSKGNGIALTPY